MEEKVKTTGTVIVIHVTRSAIIFFFVMLALIVSGFLFLPDILFPEDTIKPVNDLKEHKEVKKRNWDYKQHDFTLSSVPKDSSESEVKPEVEPIESKKKVANTEKVVVKKDSSPVPISNPIKKELLVPADYLSIDPTLFFGLPQGRTLTLDSRYSAEEQESLKSYYLKRLEALSLLRQYYAVWYLKYNNEEHPEFARFRELMVSYLSVEKERINALEGMIVNKEASYKAGIIENFDPEKEVKFRFSHISKGIKLRSYQEIKEDGF